ncbi:hypothetical protein BJP40_02625 [Streptomyces sp. CC53]|uniref:hypothetical protein n=1 Tax=Streptomyces sp. CC53 TaxID=1906740 RepID=UPI0008DCCDD7|nr:hypothetical protein [Streptomyces sp. CC53]OII63793.1 hypothetical protein BJP40_02625 [Streptomyces sp. CC53]
MVGSTSIAALDFHAAWDYLNGVATGAEQGRRNARGAPLIAEDGHCTCTCTCTVEHGSPHCPPRPA